MGFGRIEALFAGGRVVAPAGTLDLPPNPASAAGPDLRQLVLGSEGRLGVITRATVRTVPKPRPRSLPRLVPARLAARHRRCPRRRAGRAAAVDAPRLDADGDPVAARDGGPVPRRRHPREVPPASRARAGAVARPRRRERHGAVRRGRRPGGRLDPAAARRRRGRRLDRAALDRDPVPLGGAARHALGRRLRGRHARDRGRLDAPAGDRRRRSAGRSATVSTTPASGSTRSATSRTSTRTARASTRRTSSGDRPTRTRRWSGGGA